MAAKSDWWLDDASAIAREHPYTFWKPSAEVVRALRPGNLVKLIFCFTPQDPEHPRAERMWVVISDTRADHFTGTLDNDPMYLKGLVCGDPVEFQAKHIINTDLEDASSDAFEPYFKRCFVSRRILDEGMKPRYIYREAPDEDDDSGWRILEGDETEAYMDDGSNHAYVAIGVVLNADPSILQVFNEPEGAWVWNQQEPCWEKEVDE